MLLLGDLRALRLEVVGDDEQRATGSDRAEQVADTTAVGRARDRNVLCRHEIEPGGLERVERVDVDTVALDRQVVLVGKRSDVVERLLRDVAGRDPPSLLGQPDRVAALPGTDVERATSGKAVDLVDERAIRVPAPGRVAPVAVIPLGLVGRRSGATSMSSWARLKLIMPPTRLPAAAACTTPCVGSVTLPAA